MVRDELGQTPPVVQQFLVDLLAFNDNLGNPVSILDSLIAHSFSLANTLILSVLRYILHCFDH